MMTQLFVIQKINPNETVEIFQVYSDSFFQWTFENRRKETKSDKEYFPFTIAGNIKPVKRQPGPETEVLITKDGDEITFRDDYSIPANSVIAILFPENYIPDVIKFKDTPFIPVGLIGQVVARSPGQLQIVYNRLEKKSAIILHIHERLVFGLKCIATKVADQDFPEDARVMADNLFDFSVSREVLSIDAIKTEDLKNINDTINQADLIDIAKILNEILAAVKSGDKNKSKNILSKIGGLIMTGTSLGSNLATLADSGINNAGAVHQLIEKIFKYIQL